VTIAWGDLTMVRTLVALLLTLLLTVTPAAAQSTANRSPEEVLAIIELGRDVAPDDPVVVELAGRLDTLEAHCLEDRRALSDLIAGIHKVLADRGVRHSVREAAAGFATASEGLPVEGKCSDVAVAYALVVLNSPR
jgi:hypothetical protein